MNKLVKTAGKIALGAGAAYLAFGEVVYETFVNPGVRDYLKKAGVFKNPEKDAFWEQCTLNHEDNDWFDAHPMADTVLFSYRLHKETYAKVFFNDNKTDKFAVVVHGYTDSAKTMTRWIRNYLDMGFNVVVPTMIGHGQDKSYYCSMGYYDRYVVMEWIDYIISLNKDARIVIHGVSMGAATTMMVTGEKIPENVLVAVEDCGYTSAWEEYCSQVEAMLPIPAGLAIAPINFVSKLRRNFDFKEASPIKAIVNSKTPTLFIHGEKDAFVPFYMMEPLYEACGAKDKEMLAIPDAIHAVATYYDNDLYWGKVKEFVGKYIPID